MDLLITILSLLAAVVAVTPRERQLDLRVRFKVFDWIVVAVAIGALIGLEFYELLEAHFSFMPPAKNWPTGLTPKNATYLVFLAVAIILSARLRFAKLSKSRMALFRDLTEELYWYENYGEVISLVQTHLRSLFRIFRNDFVLSRLRAKFDPMAFLRYDPPIIEDLLEARDGPSKKKPRRSPYRLEGRFRYGMNSLAWRFLRLLPRSDAAQKDAAELIRRIFFAPKFVSALSRTRPYLALEIVTSLGVSFERAEFVDLYLRALMRDPHSVLFSEIRNNQNISGRRYHLPETNRVLCFLFRDLGWAKDVNVYKPVGDLMLKYLDELRVGSGRDPYNRSDVNEFEITEAWESPLFVGVRFFDIMVREALFKGMEWHMWLYYMPLVVEEIELNYRLDDLHSDKRDYEYPTRYAQILYRIFSNMRDWILAVKDVPRDQANVKLRWADDQHENSNIPKSSILAFVRCLYTVLISEHIGEGLRLLLQIWHFRFISISERQESLMTMPDQCCGR